MHKPRRSIVTGRRGAVPDVLLAVIATAALALLPAPAQADDAWWGTDKGLHYSASLLITVGGHGVSALVLEQPWQRAVAGASLGLTAGVAKEVHDLAGYGDPSWKDVVWDVAGVATGVGLALLVEVLIADEGPPPAAAMPTTLTLRF